MLPKIVYESWGVNMLAAFFQGPFSRPHVSVTSVKSSYSGKTKRCDNSVGLQSQISMWHFPQFELEFLSSRHWKCFLWHANSLVLMKCTSLRKRREARKSVSFQNFTECFRWQENWEAGLLARIERWWACLSSVSGMKVSFSSKQSIVSQAVL